MRRLWTIQPREVLEQVERDGRALVDPARRGPSRPRPAAEQYTPPVYLWLTEQLRQRQPGWLGRLPWWCYPEKPDLRWHRWRQRGAQVRLELLVEDGRVAEFPLWAWHLVFCGDAVAPTMRERRARTRQGPVEATWEALFDPDLPPAARSGPFRGSRERVAVLEEIRREDVRRVTPFRGVARYG